MAASGRRVGPARRCGRKCACRGLGGVQGRHDGILQGEHLCDPQCRAIGARGSGVGRLRPVSLRRQASKPQVRHPPRMRGIQYAAASRFNHSGLWNTGSSAFADDDDLSVTSAILAACFARAFTNSLPLFEKRAQGMPGARCTRGLVCQNCAFGAHEHTGAAETLRHPLRNGFTAYFVLSPVSGLVCHRHLQIAPQA